MNQSPINLFELEITFLPKGGKPLFTRAEVVKHEWVSIDQVLLYLRGCPGVSNLSKEKLKPFDFEVFFEKHEEVAALAPDTTLFLGASIHFWDSPRWAPKDLHLPPTLA